MSVYTDSNNQVSQTQIAIEAVNKQLRLWKIRNGVSSSTFPCETFGLDVAGLDFTGYFGENVEEDVDVIRRGVETASSSEGDPELLKTRIWSWIGLPYAIKRVGRSLSSDVSHYEPDQNRPRKNRRTKCLELGSSDEFVDDIDECVLRNESFLRSLPKNHPETAAALSPWSVGLVRMRDLPKSLFTSSLVYSPTVPNHVHALKISRVPIDALPGYTVLADKRLPTTFVQPSCTDFKDQFDRMTGGLLTGLDWNNVFVAGGLILGTLLTPDIPHTVSLPPADRSHLNSSSEWISSDIDFYIYGLDVHQANAKIRHIAEVYRSNLGSADAPFLVVRNSQTITLYSEWPRRRVQIVLKLVQNPREVLLNFDLDVCAVGWDGKEVWMLPRFVRALETGTSVFTMDLIDGHYLGERKATRDKRVFKYAKRGYGMRIIPLYTSFLSPFQSTDSKHDLNKLALDGEKLCSPPLALDQIAKTSREWTRELFSRYVNNGQWPKIRGRGKDGTLMFSHAMLDGSGQGTSNPLGRSCLTGFALFMRHVALWEMENEGKIKISEHIFADPDYHNIGQVSYDDTPMYEWDEKFTLKKFTEAIDEFNHRQKVHAKTSWKIYTHSESTNSYGYGYGSYSPRRVALPEIPAKRVTYASSVDAVLSSANDLAIPVFISLEFMEFANKLIAEALKDAELHITNATPLVKLSEGKEESLVIWNFDKVMNWQMVDRRIDEIREALWALQRANEYLGLSEIEDRVNSLEKNISQRAIRATEQEENHAFVKWVSREPCPKDFHVGMDYEDYGDDDDYDIDEDEEEEW